MVLVRSALWGNNGTQLPCASSMRGSWVGSIKFSETFDELYRSMLSSNTILLLEERAHVTLVGSKMVRSLLTSKKQPSMIGDPPVTSTRRRVKDQQIYGV